MRHTVWLPPMSDPYTVFVEPVAREIERDELRGHFGGIGAYMGRDEAGNVVLTTMRDRPAARAGVQDGDILLAVDGKAIPSDMKVEEIIALVRGEVGTQVTLTLQRQGQRCATSDRSCARADRDAQCRVARTGC